MGKENSVNIFTCSVVDDQLVAAAEKLVPQLSESASVPTRAELQEIIDSSCNTLFLARDGTAGDDIIGMLTLVVFRIPTGVRAWIEDVVVDGSARGRGVGELLSREALREAGVRKARTVDLTSRDSRVAANRLYERLGFTVRPTNVYRFTQE